MKKFIYLALLFTNFNVHSQSLSGKMEDAEKNLGYGNVDIFQNGKLVANVLTDRTGNFHVALDTGTYKCVFNYAGHLPVTKEFNVKGDEKAAVTLGIDETKKDVIAVKAPPSYGFRSSFGETAYDGTSSGYSGTLDYSGIFKAPPGSTARVSGALSAGEINDFSKWKLWQDIVSSELSSYQTAWGISPSGRYSVQVTTENGLPIANALVKLLLNSVTLFETRTDNTGKAELWLTIKNETPKVNGDLSMEVSYNGKVSKIKRIKESKDGLNALKLSVNCEMSENVDVAFVVDATGSMGDEIGFIQAEMTDIIFKSKQISEKLNFRFANVFYRDEGGNEEYVTRTFPFNRVLTEATNFINHQGANGGGDYEEAVELALEEAINKLEWSETARTRILFLVLDAPPHLTAVRIAKLQTLINEAARKGIRIVPIGASGINKSTEYLMRCLALGTNGTYTFLTNHSGIGESHIEPSTDTYDVEKMNDLMVRIIKSFTYAPDCNQEVPNLLQNMPDSTVQYPVLLVDTISDSTNTTIIDSIKLSIPEIKWSYYPNPTTGMITIIVDRDVKELYITDFGGKLLQIVSNLEKDVPQRVDLSFYATGIYLIRYPIGNKWVSGKVVVQHL